MSRSVFRDARLARGLVIEEVARRAGLPLAAAENIDAGRLEDLPPGVYARAFVRGWAGAVGLDPEEAVRGVSSVLPVAPDPFPLLREIARARPPESVLQVAAEWLEGWTTVHPLARRYAAASLDAVFLVGFSASLTALTAGICGVSVPMLMQSAGGAMSLLCVLVWALYFLCSAVGGVTPGLWLCSASPSEARRPLTLPEVFRRAQGLWLEELSIVVAFLATSRPFNAVDRDRPATT
jgi:hypothetical protein